MDVTVGICTYKRQSVRETLESVACQAGDDLRPHIVVADNDTTPSAEKGVRDCCARLGLPLTYVHAPASNISIARNAVLEATRTRWLAWIDDDETAVPDWLGGLLNRREEGEAVIGVSRAVYAADAPAWLAKCDFHSNRMTGRSDNAYTSNALLDMEFVRRHGLRFDLALGQSGGEDTLFFRDFSEAGGRIAYAPEAVVTEEVPLSRANMRWVLRRKFRAGQTHGLLCKRHDGPKYRTLPFTAGLKMGVSLTAALFSLPGTSRSRLWLARAALHAGALSFRFRNSIIAEYRS